MREATKVIAGVLAIVLICVLPFFAMGGASSTATADAPVQSAARSMVIEQPQGLPVCNVIPSGKNVRIVCKLAGVTILNQVVPLPVLPPVTLPPLPPVTQILPGQTKTVTVRPPPQTNTVQVPGPTKTKTVTEPGGRRTKTENVRPPSNRSRQTPPPGDTIGPNDRGDEPFTRFDIDPSDHDLSAGEVGIGLGFLILFVGLLLIALYSGYVLGYKDKEKDDVNFMRALLVDVKSRRGKHR